MSLAGRTIAVTRPRGQDGSLAAAIAQHGGTPLIAPLIEITALSDAHALVRLQQAAAKLEQFALAIFISANAVTHGLPTLLAQRTDWPRSVATAAVGPGTAHALAQHGVPDCLLPTAQFDSEHLLARPELQAEAIKGKSVLLIRGEGGRELLADTLQQRGAHVCIVACYRRSAPENIATPFRKAWQSEGLDGILLSSSEGLHNLLAHLAPADLTHLQDTPLFVPHPRIADNAMRAGLHHVILTPPAESGMMAGLLAYPWSPR